MTPEIQQTEFETLYKAAVESADLSRLTRAVANKVMDRLFETAKDKKSNGLTERIAAAATSGDLATIFALVEELKQTQSAEEARNERLYKLTEEFTFPELLHAYNTDFKDLTYEIGLIIIQQMKEGAPKEGKKSASKPRKGMPSYKITRGSKHVIVKPRPGVPLAPGLEREFFEFMGFNISEDGKAITPSTFRNNKGQMVAVTKKAVVTDVAAGSQDWADRGYAIAIIEPKE